MRLRFERTYLFFGGSIRNECRYETSLTIIFARAGRSISIRVRIAIASTIFVPNVFLDNMFIVPAGYAWSSSRSMLLVPCCSVCLNARRSAKIILALVLAVGQTAPSSNATITPVGEGVGTFPTATPIGATTTPTRRFTVRAAMFPATQLPWFLRDEKTGEYTGGFMPALLRELASRANLDIKFVPLTDPNLMTDFDDVVHRKISNDEVDMAFVGGVSLRSDPRSRNEILLRRRRRTLWGNS